MDNPEINNIANNQIPVSMPVAVILQKQPAKSQWIDYLWEAISVIPGLHEGEQQFRPMHEEGDTGQYIFSGLTVTLHKDECESYYHNLMSPEPSCYVTARFDDAGQPIPFLITLDFDEAHAYLEGDETVYAVNIPPEFYRWIEAYVIANYFPVKRKKRKRNDWKSAQTKRPGIL